MNNNKSGNATFDSFNHAKKAGLDAPAIIITVDGDILETTASRLSNLHRSLLAQKLSDRGHDDRGGRTCMGREAPLFLEVELQFPPGIIAPEETLADLARRFGKILQIAFLPGPSGRRQISAVCHGPSQIYFLIDRLVLSEKEPPLCHPCDMDEAADFHEGIFKTFRDAAPERLASISMPEFSLIHIVDDDKMPKGDLEAALLQVTTGLEAIGKSLIHMAQEKAEQIGKAGVEDWSSAVKIFGESLKEIGAKISR